MLGIDHQFQSSFERCHDHPKHTDPEYRTSTTPLPGLIFRRCDCAGCRSVSLVKQPSSQLRCQYTAGKNPRLPSRWSPKRLETEPAIKIVWWTYHFWGGAALLGPEATPQDPVCVSVDFPMSSTVETASKSTSPCNSIYNSDGLGQFPYSDQQKYNIKIKVLVVFGSNFCTVLWPDVLAAHAEYCAPGGGPRSTGNRFLLRVFWEVQRPSRVVVVPGWICGCD